MARKLQVAFDREGNMMWHPHEIKIYRDTVTGKEIDYAWGQYWQDRYRAGEIVEEHIQPTYKDNYEFTATLKLEDFSFGRSAVNGNFVDTATGAKYVMSWGNMEDILLNHLEKGFVTGIWTFTKHGGYYSLVMV